MRTVLLIAAFLCIAGGCVSDPEIPSHRTAPSDPDRQQEVLYGNLYGRIRVPGGMPEMSEIRIRLCRSPVRRVSEKTARAVRAEEGWILVPESGEEGLYARPGPDGRFLINRIPVRGESSRFTVVMSEKRRPRIIMERVPILPGASMALQVLVTWPAPGPVHVVTGLESSPYITARYSDETKPFNP
jgi:hypothetical protein